MQVETLFVAISCGAWTVGTSAAMMLDQRRARGRQIGEERGEEPTGNQRDCNPVGSCASQSVSFVAIFVRGSDIFGAGDTPMSQGGSVRQELLLDASREGFSKDALAGIEILEGHSTVRRIGLEVKRVYRATVLASEKRHARHNDEHRFDARRSSGPRPRASGPVMLGQWCGTRFGLLCPGRNLRSVPT